MSSPRTPSADDKKYLWHPFTQMKEWEQSERLVIVEGDGALLKDIDGREYIDGVSSIWCNVHGHRRKEIDDAIRAQLDRIAHSTLLGLANLPSIKLAEKLVRITPEGLNRVFFSDDGSTAVEVAPHHRRFTLAIGLLKIGREIDRVDQVQFFMMFVEQQHGALGFNAIMDELQGAIDHLFQSK